MYCNHIYEVKCKALELMFQGRPGEQKAMRDTIIVVEKEWFEKVITEQRTGRGKEKVKFIPTEKHIVKMRLASSAIIIFIMAGDSDFSV